MWAGGWWYCSRSSCQCCWVWHPASGCKIWFSWSSCEVGISWPVFLSWSFLTGFSKWTGFDAEWQIPKWKTLFRQLWQKIKKNHQNHRTKPQQKWHFHRILSAVTIWLKVYVHFCITYMDIHDPVSPLKIVTIATALDKVLYLEQEMFARFSKHCFAVSSH